MMALPTRVSLALSEPFDVTQRDFDTLVNRLFNQPTEGNDVPFAPYAVDVREDADHVYVVAELPGFRKEDLDITLENQTLTVSAARKSEPKNDVTGEWLLKERRIARFLRSFKLPPTVDETKVDAKLSDGLLTIKLTKREETKPRKISVS